MTALDAAIREHDPSHVFALFSGGHDSLVATHLAAQHPRFTAAVHINTGVGIEQTREFVRETCREQGWTLLQYGPPNSHDKQPSYSEMVLKAGFPGPAQHSIMYRNLKERSLRVLLREHRDGKRPVLLSTGIRRGESVRRMEVPESHREGRKVWVSPIAGWSKADCNAYIEQHSLARNLVVDLLHMSGECLCGAFAREGEMAELERWFPDTAEWLHRLERRVERAGRIGCVWGHRPDAVHREQGRLFPILPLCQSCEARRAA